LLAPKSASLTTPSRLTSTLPPFRSLHMTRSSPSQGISSSLFRLGSASALGQSKRALVHKGVRTACACSTPSRSGMPLLANCTMHMWSTPP
jgi:hypothetical protein